MRLGPVKKRHYNLIRKNVRKMLKNKKKAFLFEKVELPFNSTNENKFKESSTLTLVCLRKNIYYLYPLLND